MKIVVIQVVGADVAALPGLELAQQVVGRAAAAHPDLEVASGSVAARQQAPRNRAAAELHLPAFALAREE